MSEPTRRRRSHSLRRRWRKAREWWHLAHDIKRDLVLAGTGLALAGLAFGAFRLAGPVWRAWRQPPAQAPVQTPARAEPDGHRHALQALQRATEADPNDPRVWREAMGVLSKIGSPEAVVARKNLARLGPGELGLRVALVMEALRFRGVQAAGSERAVRDGAGENGPGFHRLAAAVALALGRMEEYERHLGELVEADPDDATARFNLAALRLWSADDAVSAAAAAELAGLTAEPALRVRVALERLKFAAAAHDTARVESEVAALLPLLRPDLAGRAPGPGGPGGAPGWDALIEGLRRTAAAGPRDAALLARWLGEQGQGAEALAWLEGLPEPVRTAAEVRTAAAELAARGDDLERLRDRLREGAWGRMPPEAVDLVLAARIQRLRFGEKHARVTWEDAVAASLDSLAGLHALAWLGGIWNDRDGADLALQAIVDRYPREYWACEALGISYGEQRDMDKLWRLYQTWAPREQDNKPVQQTWILLGAMLNRGETGQLGRAEALLTAEGEAPETATLLAVAAARWRAGKLEEAEAALARLSPEARAEPRAQVWAAVFAADRDDLETLGDVLAKLPRGELMREEQLVLANALAASERRRRVAEREASAHAAADAGGAMPAEASPAEASPPGATPEAPTQVSAPVREAAAKAAPAPDSGSAPAAPAAPTAPVAPVVVFP